MDPPTNDLRACVVAELHRRTGELRAVADAAGVAYDTVLRIKNGEGDPGYSKVRALADYLFGSADAKRGSERAAA